METCDGLLCTSDHRLLTGDDTQVRDSTIEQLGIASRAADTHVDDDLLETGNLIDVSELELFVELVAHFVVVLFLQTRSSHSLLTFLR